MKSLSPLSGFLLAVMLSFASTTQAQIPNGNGYSYVVDGIYGGSFHGYTNGYCDPDVESFSGTFELILSNFDGYNFDATIVATSIFGVDVFEGTGNFGESFAIEAENSEEEIFVSGSVNFDSSGVLQSGTINYFHTQEIGGSEGSCETFGEENVGSFTRVSGDALVPGATGGNNIINNPVTLEQFVNLLTSTFGHRIFNRIRGGGSRGLRRFGHMGAMYEDEIGLSSGNGATLLGVWGGYSYTELENDFYRTKYDGDRHMFLGGVDFSPAENMLVGVSLGYEDTNIDTDFNNGDADSDGWTIAPYFGMVLNDTWNIDASLGYSNIETDQYRALVPGGTRITSDVDTDRWFVSANLNGFTQVNNWLLTGRFGIMHAESDDDSYTESDGTNVASRDIELTQLNIGGEAAYSMGDFEPFIGATYNYDLDSDDIELAAGKQPDDDDDDVLMTAGFRYYTKGGPSVTLDYSKRLGREDYDEDTINLNLRWDF